MPLIHSRNNNRSSSLFEQFNDFYYENESDNIRSSRPLLPISYEEIFEEEEEENNSEEDYSFSILARNNMDTNSDSSSNSSSSSSSSSRRRTSTSDSDNNEDDDNNQMSDHSDTSDVEEEEDDGIINRPRVDIYRLAIRTNSEILEDLAAIIRILRQINALYRVFNNTRSNSFTSGLLRSYRSRNSIVTLNRNYNISFNSIEEEEVEEYIINEEEEEANKLLEAGLEDLQAVLTSENRRHTNQYKKQSALALLSLITYQYNHCSQEYLSKYLDPNGEYNPTLAILAAASYDEEDSIQIRSCRDIILAAEEIYGPDWLKEFNKGKEGALRKMLEKLTFVAKIRLKVRDANPPAIR